LKKGQDIDTVILSIDRDNKRISLGLKQLQPDPWSTVAQRFPMGSRVTGKVVRLTDFGAFVELEPGVDGLLHVSQMSHRPVNRPEDLVSVGDELSLLVIRVDPNDRAQPEGARARRGAAGGLRRRAGRWRRARQARQEPGVRLRR
jgi:ribosomal protein S1